MATNTQVSNAGVNAECNALVDLLDNGYIRIYDGSQPANADTAVGSQVLLAELRFGTPAFGNAAAGVATANAITADASANASGTATWCRVLGSDGTTVYFDGNVGTSASNLNMNSVAISSGAQVSCSSFVYTVDKN
jgi:hypothetical protein